MERKALNEAVHYRELRIDEPANTESRTVPASLSSEIEVERYYGREVLIHETGAIDLSRAADGLPLLWNHDADQPIGLVENIRIDKAKKCLRGDLRFSRNAKAEEVWNDVKDGFLKNLSIGYRINDWVESNDSDLIRVIKWSLHECSVAPVPADPTVGIHRSFSKTKEIIAVTETTETTQAVITPPEFVAPPELTAIRRDLDIAGRAAAAAAVKAERERMNEVGSVFDLPTVPNTADFIALRARALQDGWSADQVRKIVLDAMCANAVPATDHRSITDDGLGVPNSESPVNSTKETTVRANTVLDTLDKFKVGVTEAFAVRAGLDNTKDAITRARAGGFVGMRLSRMAEHYLQLVGVNTRGMNDDQLAQRALTTRASGMTTSDFANILANTANKALLLGWEQAPETWESWTRRGQVPDFKSATRTGLSGFSSLAVVPEDGEITYGKFTDRKETIQAVSYAKKFRLTYQAIKNDDLNAFTAIPRGMGRAAQSVIGDIVYNLLDGTGPTLNQDSTALWDTSTHKNYVAAATAPNVTTLDTAFTAMAKQTDPNTGKVLNIAPRYLLVPKALETTARILNTSMYDPAASPGSTSGKNTMTPNPFMNRLEVISDARLDGQTNGTAAWYLAADPNRFDTVEVAFVDGIAEPYLREEQEWDTRGVEWVVGVDFGVAALDYRALHKYKGNT